MPALRIATLFILAWLASKFFAWPSARAITEAPTEARRSLPVDCPAFYFDRSIYACEPFGTTQQHPYAFIALLLAFAGALMYALFRMLAKDSAQP